jgi:exosortase K
MINQKNLPFYLICILVFVLLKFGYTRAEPQELKILIAPTSEVVEVLTSSGSRFISDSGYFNQKLNIIIDKSCSGFNFMILCFLCLSFTAIKHLRTNLQKLLAIFFLLMASWFITIFVNASRIILSVFIHFFGMSGSLSQESWMHQAEGVFVYLFFLISIQLVFNHFLNKISSKHAKLT